MLDLVASENVGSIISPKHIIANKVLRYVRALEQAEDSNVESLYRIMDETVEALEFIALSEHPGLTGIPLKDMKVRSDILVCCIIRKGKIIIPKGQDTIEVGDHVVVVTTIRKLMNLKDILE